MNVVKNKPSFKAGMFLLETLTAGMYNDPLSIYREYIQNAVDSIDCINDRSDNLEIRITLDIDKKRITISDNGSGISANDSERILSSIGSSDKVGTNLRGFRGIGRLGGLAFCGKATYRTKARGETYESVQEWECNKLRESLSIQSNSKMSLKELFRKVTHFNTNNGKNINDSYFEVALEDVSSFRNYIFDLRKVYNYISSVAPVPFSIANFRFSNEIDEFLNHNLRHYGKYNIILNGMYVYKPYSDKVKISNNKFDNIKEIKFIKLTDNDENIAVGWIGEREKLSGSIVRGDPSSGIRVRVGNILIGDSHLLDKCFRESRFNGYLVGELHVTSNDLIPNSRRDDFIDNSANPLFYNSVEKYIGIPISKEIRSRSQLNNLTSNLKNSLVNKNEVNSKNIFKNCNGCPEFKLILKYLEKSFYCRVV